MGYWSKYMCKSYRLTITTRGDIFTYEKSIPTADSPFDRDHV